MSIEVANKLLYEKLCDSYNMISAHIRAYRDICRREGLDDKQIKENIDHINSDAMHFIESVTMKINEIQENRNG